MRYSDVLGLTYNEIKAKGRKFEGEAFQTLKSVAKKRFKNIEKSGLINMSPALRDEKLSELKRALLSSRNIDESEKRTRYFILKRFLKSETSFVRNIKEYIKNLEKMVGLKYTPQTADEYAKIFEIVRFIENNHDIFYFLYGSSNVINTVSNVYRSNNYSFDDLLSDISGGMSVEELKNKYDI